MGLLHLTRETSAAPEVAWAVLTDFAGYGRWMPMTTMRVDPGPVRLGWGFAGLSGWGPLTFSDSMLVSAWEPPVDGGPARFRVVKTGRLLGGWAEVTVTPREAGGTRVDWVEEVVVRPLPFPDLIAPALDRVSRWLYGRAVDAMLARAEQTHAEAPRGRAS
jgi:uncharacterized protein YndB with AHSA1/START domain